MKSITIAGRNDDRVNVLEVIGNAAMGGMENYIKSFIANLPENEFRVTCIVPFESPFTDELRKLGVEDVFITPIADDPEWRSIQLAVEVCRLHQIDVLHAHMPKAHVLAGLAGCLINKPVVATVHGMNVTSHELGIHRAVGSHLITNCQEAYTQALAMGVTADKVDLIRNGVDINVFTPKASANKLRESLGISDDTPLVGFVGRLENEKGPDQFLRMADYVHQTRPDVHFVIVGEGSMRKQLEEMCKHMRLEDNVQFRGWWPNTEDVYPAFDLLAHTSRSDGTSLVLLEAMACGCVTIGLAVGGVREIIENESTGFVAGAGDWVGVGVRVLQLLEQPDKLQKMKLAARERLVQHFNVATNTRRTAEFLRKIAGKQNQRFTNNNTFTPELTGRTSAFDGSKG